MKSIKLIIAIFGASIAVILLSQMIKLDENIKTHIEHLIQICEKDELIIKVTDYMIYNGISDFNGKYSLMIHATDLNGRDYIVPESETIDSLIKYKNSKFITIIYEDSTRITLKGRFDCPENAHEFEDEFWK